LELHEGLRNFRKKIVALPKGHPSNQNIFIVKAFLPSWFLIQDPQKLLTYHDMVAAESSVVEPEPEP
jgi:hypothetical protein